MAPILCAGVTTYKGIKETEAKPGEWIAISGIGGLGHIAIQYAKAMGLHVAALDVTEEKLALARVLGAEATVDAKSPDAVAQIVKLTGGGAHGALVTAVSPPAFSQALHMVRRKGTVSLVGLPPGDFPTPIFDVVMKRITLRGSIVGGREDLAHSRRKARSMWKSARRGWKDGLQHFFAPSLLCSPAPAPTRSPRQLNTYEPASARIPSWTTRQTIWVGLFPGITTRSRSDLERLFDAWAVARD